MAQLRVIGSASLILFFAWAAHASAVVDDCTPLREAIRTLPIHGGNLVVKNGTYECAAPVVLNRNHVHVRGESERGVLFRLKDFVHAPLFIIGDPLTIIDSKGDYVAAHRVEDVSLSQVTLDGNRLNHDPAKECGEHACGDDPIAVRNNALTIRGASQIYVHHVTTHSSISGGLVTEKHSDHLRVTDFTSYDNYFDGLAGYETEESEFRRLDLSRNRGAGISIDLGFNANALSDAKLHDNGDVGIFARNLGRNKFARFDIQRGGSHGVFMAVSEEPNSCAHDNEFSDLTISGSRGTGFWMNDDCPGNRITGSSNLCGNGRGGFYERRAGSVQVDAGVLCR